MREVRRERDVAVHDALRTCLADGLRPPQGHFFAPLRALRRRGSRSMKLRPSPGSSPEASFERSVETSPTVFTASVASPGVLAPFGHGASLVSASHLSTKQVLRTDAGRHDAGTESL